MQSLNKTKITTDEFIKLMEFLTKKWSTVTKDEILKIFIKEF